MLVFTIRKIGRAKLSRKIYINVGIPNVKNIKHMFSTNMISNCTISVAYISNSERIYGPSTTSIKGRSTRIKPIPVINDNIQITS